MIFRHDQLAGDDITMVPASHFIQLGINSLAGRLKKISAQADELETPARVLRALFSPSCAWAACRLAIDACRHRHDRDGFVDWMQIDRMMDRIATLRGTALA